ncbi:hypothetical protein N7516_010534, partial [Penicillium verrucosum]|uniref:uncharacterized protein n=1 Tax=Penicillium verrucosum TaxID=60171 RepID=UPI0025457ACE
ISRNHFRSDSHVLYYVALYEKEGNTIYYLKLAPTTLEKYGYIIIVYRIANSTFKGLTTITEVLIVKLLKRREL